MVAEIYQILETSDLPAGVVNILTGDHADLAGHAAKHQDIDAVWSFSGADISGLIEKGSASNLKRTWVNNGTAVTPPRATGVAAATDGRRISGVPLPAE